VSSTPAGQRGEPALPPSFTAQPAWGFRDPIRDITYELVRVYGPSRFLRSGSDVEGQPLDERRSYWRATPGASSGASPRGRALTFAQARERMGSRLGFTAFSTIEHMRDFLVEALDPDRMDMPPRSHRPTTTMDLVAPSTPRAVPR
jgi:hypothetical protein